MNCMGFRQLKPNKIPDQLNIFGVDFNRPGRIYGGAEIRREITHVVSDVEPIQRGMLRIRKEIKNVAQFIVSTYLYGTETIKQ